MKNVTITTLILVLMTLAFSCKTSKFTTPIESSDPQITFGSGGGFSGIVTDYTMLTNGQLFKRSSTDKKFVELPKLDKKLVKQMFNNYDFLKIGEMTYNDPGNMYHFITFKDKNNKETKVMWSELTEVPANLKTFYKTLNSLTRSPNPTQ